MKNHYQIELTNIGKSYVDQYGKKTNVFQGFCATFDQTKSYAIIGHSGCGKTTLLNIVAGFDKYFEGNLSYSNIALNEAKTSHKKKTPTFGVIFQSNYLIEQLSCLENVALAAIAQSIGQKESIKRASELLERLEVGHKKNSFPSQLSGGQQARVCIARALIIEPDFLLADEPTANLDFQTAQKVIDALLDLKNRFNTGLIIGTHDNDLAQKLEVTIKVGQ